MIKKKLPDLPDCGLLEKTDIKSLITKRINYKLGEINIPSQAVYVKTF